MREGLQGSFAAYAPPKHAHHTREPRAATTRHRHRTRAHNPCPAFIPSTEDVAKQLAEKDAIIAAQAKEIEDLSQQLANVKVKAEPTIVGLYGNKEGTIVQEVEQLLYKMDQLQNDKNYGTELTTCVQKLEFFLWEDLGNVETLEQISNGGGMVYLVGAVCNGTIEAKQRAASALEALRRHEDNEETMHLLLRRQCYMLDKPTSQWAYCHCERGGHYTLKRHLQKYERLFELDDVCELCKVKYNL